MRMIAGLEDATEGDIIVDGKRVNDLEPKDRDVAMVFQSYALYPNMNVYENIRFPLKVRGIDPKSHDEKVDGQVRWWNLTISCTASRPNFPAVSVSALPWPAPSCANRTCFLMDEPLSNLDAKLRVSTRAQIKNLPTNWP